MRDVVKIFKALSDPNRLRILKMLEIRPLCVCEITEVLQLAPSTVSKHLSLLRDMEFILDEKEGKWVNYSLNGNKSNHYVVQLTELVKQWLPDDKTVLADARKINTIDRNTICGI